MRPSMTWLNNQWWLSRRQPAYDWVMSALSVVLSTQVRRHRKFGEVSCTECTGQKNDFELIQMVKMETRNPIEGYFCSEFPAICNHCRVMLAWSRKMLNIFEKCLHFLNKTSYRKIFKILFIKFSSQPDWCVVFKFREIWLTGNLWNVRCLLDKIKQNFAWLSSCRYCANHAKICQGQPPTTYSRMLQISSKSVHFWRSWAELVNNATSP